MCMLNAISINAKAQITHGDFSDTIIAVNLNYTYTLRLVPNLEGRYLYYIFGNALKLNNRSKIVYKTSVSNLYSRKLFLIPL